MSYSENVCFPYETGRQVDSTWAEAQAKTVVSKRVNDLRNAKIKFDGDEGNDSNQESKSGLFHQNCNQILFAICTLAELFKKVNTLRRWSTMKDNDLALATD